MTKLWNCYYRGKLVGVSHNVQSAGLLRDMPDLDALMAMLPCYVRHMQPQCWWISGNYAETSIGLITKAGRYYPHRVTCLAYDA